MAQYKWNHYVPRWYQEGFIPVSEPVRNLKYLDLSPDQFTTPNGKVITDKAVKTKGTSQCFALDDLYTAWFGEERNTQIEQVLFGAIDTNAINSIRYFEEFDHTKIDYEAYRNMMPYLSSQRLRTPRGLKWLSDQTGLTDKVELLNAMAYLRNMYSAMWSECIWQIADADNSETKFIISDNPVTVYNKEIGTHNKTWNREKSDPDPALFGSHVVFALSMNKVLILTHPGWAKNPFRNGMIRRPNLNPARQTIFNYTNIQIERHLSEEEVKQINFILKSCAQRYIAAYNEEWLYPENDVNPNEWNKFGDGILLLPDPRSLNIGGDVFVGFSDGSTYAQDEYGRPPTDRTPSRVEWDTLHKIQGIFANKYGPTRRGRSFDLGGFEKETDNPGMHELFMSRYRPRGSEAKKHKIQKRYEQHRRQRKN